MGVSSTTSFFSSHHKNRPAIWPALICGRLSEREGANCPSTAQNFRQNRKKRATTTAHAAVFPRGRKCTRRGAATSEPNAALACRPLRRRVSPSVCRLLPAAFCLPPSVCRLLPPAFCLPSVCCPLCRLLPAASLLPPCVSCVLSPLSCARSLLECLPRLVCSVARARRALPPLDVHRAQQ